MRAKLITSKKLKILILLAAKHCETYIITKQTDNNIIEISLQFTTFCFHNTRNTFADHAILASWNTSYCIGYNTIGRSILLYLTHYGLVIIYHMINNNGFFLCLFYGRAYIINDNPW